MKNLQFLSRRQSYVIAIFFALLLAMTVSLMTKAAVVAPITGEWTAEVSKKQPDLINVSFNRRSNGGNGDYNNMSSRTLSMSEFQGLSAGLVNSPKTDVTFSLNREAGSIAFEGYFREGRGTGFWTFTPNANFHSMMKAKYGYLNDEEMLRATLNNLTGKYMDEMKAAGFGDLEYDQLVRAAGHNITRAYIADLKNAGFSGLTMDELIRAQNHQISSAYAAEVKAMGFPDQTMDNLIRMKNHDITPEYLSQVKAMGFENQTIDSLIRLKNRDINPEFISKMRSTGFKDLTIDNLIRLKSRDITPEYVSDIKAEGFSNVDVEEVIRLKSRNIDRDFIRRAKAQYPNATLEDLVRLQGRGTVK